MIKCILILNCIATMLACTPSVKSTIDITLQEKVDSILQEKIIEIGVASGHAIVMEVQTGEIKAMAGEGKSKVFGFC